MGKKKREWISPNRDVVHFDPKKSTRREAVVGMPVRVSVDADLTKQYRFVPFAK